MHENKPQNKAPAKEVSVGDASVTIWENQYERDGHTRSFLTATIMKNYTDRDGKRRSSRSFTRKELADAKRAIEEALEFMEHFQGDGREATPTAPSQEGGHADN